MPETVTYRGRSLEEVLPKIREELGPDAVIERQRTGLVGGVGGFFQREMVEVDARPAKPGESASAPGTPAGGGLNVLAGADEEDDLRAATRGVEPPAPAPTRAEEREEGLSAPAMQRIARQSEPFADLLRDAEADLPPLRDDAPAPTAARGNGAADLDDAAAADEDDVPELGEQDWEAWGDELAPPRTGPSPGGSFAANAYRTAGTEPEPEPEPDPAEPSAPAGPRFSPEADAGIGEVAEPPRITRAPRPARSARPAPPAPPVPPTPAAAAPELAPAEPAPAAPARPAGAAQLEAKLAASGVSPELATALVAEAISHAAPFATTSRGGLKRLVRLTLARRIPVQAGFGAHGRTIALVGPPGAGKTRATAALAAAYGRSDLPVVVMSLKPRDVGAELTELLDPHAVAVRPVDDGDAARTHLGARAGDAVALLDTPAVSARDQDGIEALRKELAAAGVSEVHVVLPATLARPVAAAALAAYAPLAPAAVLITHADETDHLGPLVDLAVEQGVPLSYVASGPDLEGALVLADPAALAQRLVP